MVISENIKQNIYEPLNYPILLKSPRIDDFIQ